MKNLFPLIGLVSASLLHLACPFVIATQKRSLVRSSLSAVDILHIDHHVLPHVATKPSSTQEGLSTSEAEVISPMESTIRKITMLTFVASMCIFLPLSLLPLMALDKAGLIERTRREELALDAGQSCTRVLLKTMPFLNLHVESDAVDCTKEPEPSIWVCNHTSMLDTFILLASDRKLRGPNKRPIKVIYWKGLEDNPICNILFKLSGFIPVEMEANGSGNANSYDKKSFIRLLRQTKQAFAEGFDILVLPEGQLNPWPELGLLEVFPGAHKLSLISKRPIHMVAIHGLHKFWSEDPAIGMTVSAKDAQIRAYSGAKIFESGEEFVKTFRTVVGYYGATGLDHPHLEEWLDGKAWKSTTNEGTKGSKIEDAEEAIREVLQREAHEQNLFEAKKEVVAGPVGVRTCKFPPTIHAMKP